MQDAAVRVKTGGIDESRDQSRHDVGSSDNEDVYITSQLVGLIDCIGWGEEDIRYGDKKDEGVGGAVEDSEEELAWPRSLHGGRHGRMVIAFVFLGML